MALIIEHSIRPLPHGSQPGDCCQCGRGLARWSVESGDRSGPYCAKCILYDKQWMDGKSGDLDELILRVESNLSRSIRDQSGELTDNDAYRIMTSVVMISFYAAKVAGESP